MKRSQRFKTWSDGDLLQASSLQTSHSTMVTLVFLALDLTVSQTSDFPPSSWQPRKVTTLLSPGMHKSKNNFTTLKKILTVFGDDFLANHGHANLGRLEEVNASYVLQPVAHILSDDCRLAVLFGKEKEIIVQSFKVTDGINFPNSARNWASINHNLLRNKHPPSNQMPSWKFNLLLVDWLDNWIWKIL